MKQPWFQILGESLHKPESMHWYEKFEKAEKPPSDKSMGGRINSLLALQQLGGKSKRTLLKSKTESSKLLNFEKMFISSKAKPLDHESRNQCRSSFEISNEDAKKSLFKSKTLRSKKSKHSGPSDKNVKYHKSKSLRSKASDPNEESSDPNEE